MLDAVESGGAPRVLLIAADEGTRALARRALAEARFDVLDAPDGEAARTLLAQGCPDLVLLDVADPRGDGFALLDRIRRSPEHHATPVMVMAASEDTGAIDRAYAAGATDFTVKPLDWSMLRHRLCYMLRSQELLRELAEAQRIACLGSWGEDLSSGAMVWSNQMYRILGLAPGGQCPDRAALLAHIPEAERARFERAREEAVHGREPAELVHGVEGAQGEGRVVHHRLAAVRDAHGRVVRLSGTVQDVTERHETQRRIRRLAYFDRLTGLPNRESFREHLERAVGRASREQHLLAVLYLDVDDFKRINDTLGHGVGDQLLVAVGARLSEAMRHSDFVVRLSEEGEEQAAARLGGDEFAVLLSNIRAPEDVARVAQRVVDRLAAPFRVGDQEVLTSASLGAALYPQDGRDADALLKHADLAMYAAKRGGKSLVRFFDGAMNAQAERRLAMDQQLRRALERDELALVYQPQLDLANGEIEGVEALLRWNSATLGAVAPGEFIHVAEESGLILSIGQWVLERACAQARAWFDSGLPIARVAVNISALQFAQPDFVHRVADCLRRSGLHAGALELEITESLLAKDADGAIRTLRALKALGVALSIDDFGTGYSSLSYLKLFPIDRLKIDRSFVTDLVSDPDDAAITAAVIAMASRMDVKVIAEGVETASQLKFLKSRKCDEVQGYYVSRPLAPDALEALVRERPGRALIEAAERPAGPEPVLLVLDDEPRVTDALTRVLAREPYRVVVANTPRSAFDLLTEVEVDVVLTDFEMPEMDGAEFLQRVRKLYPQTVRLMLTGRDDRDAVIGAVNDGEVYRFLEKPVSPKTLKDVLRKAFDHRAGGVRDAVA